MQTRIAISRPENGHTLQATIRSLPSEVSATLFVRLASHYRPGAKQISCAERSKLIHMTSLLQKLPSAEQVLLLSRASTQGNLGTARVLSKTPTPRLAQVRHD
jgi:hypothetical protein